jgi:alpha-D-ribose 1-methylphosphonate 5-triphosphate synthase subunit PhnG
VRALCVCVCVRVGGGGECVFVGMSSLARIVLSVGKHTIVYIYHYASS